jgi:phosphatidylserine/phosphatidylglycerophosphate/cardiolipin synthase-like enzyme
MMNAARGLKNELENLARNIYVESTDYDFGGLEIKPKIINYDFAENIEHDVIFDEIKDTIVQGIRGAKYTIWVAVAWFTDNEIYEELLLRKNEGVNVRVITSEEESNKWQIENLRQNFDLKTIPKWGYNSRHRLHDKFCIIDLEYVMHGSYNWSKNAQNSEETWATALDRDFVKKFADEFVRLYNKNQA